eukprot:4231774-Pleurochrysis_carterae.AAC.1
MDRGRVRAQLVMPTADGSISQTLDTHFGRMPRAPHRRSTALRAQTSQAYSHALRPEVARSSLLL